MAAKKNGAAAAKNRISLASERTKLTDEDLVKLRKLWRERSRAQAEAQAAQGRHDAYVWGLCEKYDAQPAEIKMDGTINRD